MKCLSANSVSAPKKMLQREFWITSSGAGSKGMNKEMNEITGGITVESLGDWNKPEQSSSNICMVVEKCY